MRQVVPKISLGVAAIAASALVSTVTAAPVAADVEDFTFTSWDVQYQISPDDQGRAMAEVTEEIVAQFPDHDQNRGMVRGIPLRHEGAPAAPENITVEDDAGNAVPFELDTESGEQLILTGDDSYVHGAQTYRISYQVPDVIHPTEDNAGRSIDAFHWNLLPFDREQPIQSFSAQISLEPGLAEHALEDSATCAQGEDGSTDPCEITGSDIASADSAGLQLAVSVEGLGPDEGVTVAQAFTAGTVVQPSERQPNPILDYSPLVLLGLGLLGAGMSGRSLYRLVARRRADTGNLVPRYGVPHDLPPLVAQHLVSITAQVLPAQILHLAVQGIIRIHQDDADDTAAPVLELVDPDRAQDPVDRQTVTALFNDGTTGSTVDLSQKDSDRDKRLQKLLESSKDEVISRGLMEKVTSRSARLWGAAGILACLLMAIPLIMGASRGNTVIMVICLLGGVAVVSMGLFALAAYRVHTHSGAQAHQQLEDLEHRLKQADTSLVPRTVTAVESALPYAVLFGDEQPWADHLDTTYQHAGIVIPTWLPGATWHAHGGFGDSLGNLTSSMESSAALSAATASSVSGAGVAGAGGGGGSAGGR